MGNGDTSGGGYDDSEDAAAAFLQSDINMQNAVSSYRDNKMTNFMSPSYYHHDQLHRRQGSTGIGSGLVFGNEIGVHNRVPSQISSQTSSGSDSGGVMESSGRLLFTATQWEELERQTTIYKYIMASIPVPPQLLLPLSTQSNKAGMELRFSNGSDLEPWRCRRTDGKKWRCSRDAAPDQKYCERHVHKSRPRSRKPVEIPPHNTTITTTPLHITPSVTSSYQHPRRSEWCNLNPVSSNQQFQQTTTNPPRVGSKRNHFFPQDLEINHEGFNNLHASSSAGSDPSERRQHFIDAWSRSGVAGDNCSLTLSMQCSGGNHGIDHDDHSFQIGEDGDVLKSGNQWVNQGSWMGSPPGGPLGEALGLGITSVKGRSPHGHSSSTTTSSSCDNGGSHDHEFSFIR